MQTSSCNIDTFAHADILLVCVLRMCNIITVNVINSHMDKILYCDFFIPNIPSISYIPLPSAQPESVTIHPVNATAVRIQWSAHQYLSTTLRYISYFTATGAVMSHYETVLSPHVATTEVSLHDTVEGYGHNFTLHYIISCDDTVVPVTVANFDFGKYIS